MQGITLLSVLFALFGICSSTNVAIVTKDLICFDVVAEKYLKPNNATVSMVAGNDDFTIGPLTVLPQGWSPAEAERGVHWWKQTAKEAIKKTGVTGPKPLSPGDKVKFCWTLMSYPSECGKTGPDAYQFTLADSVSSHTFKFAPKDVQCPKASDHKLALRALSPSTLEIEYPVLPQLRTATHYTVYVRTPLVIQPEALKVVSVEQNLLKDATVSVKLDSRRRLQIDVRGTPTDFRGLLVVTLSRLPLQWCGPHVAVELSVGDAVKGTKKSNNRLSVADELDCDQEFWKGKSQVFSPFRDLDSAHLRLNPEAKTSEDANQQRQQRQRSVQEMLRKSMAEKKVKAGTQTVETDISSFMSDCDKSQTVLGSIQRHWNEELDTYETYFGVKSGLENPFSVYHYHDINQGGCLIIGITDDSNGGNLLNNLHMFIPTWGDNSRSVAVMGFVMDSLNAVSMFIPPTSKSNSQTIDCGRPMTDAFGLSAWPYATELSNIEINAGSNIASGATWNDCHLEFDIGSAANPSVASLSLDTAMYIVIKTQGVVNPTGIKLVAETIVLPNTFDSTSDLVQVGFGKDTIQVAATWNSQCVMYCLDRTGNTAATKAALKSSPHHNKFCEYNKPCTVTLTLASAGNAKIDCLCRLTHQDIADNLRDTDVKTLSSIQRAPVTAEWSPKCPNALSDLAVSLMGCNPVDEDVLRASLLTANGFDGPTLPTLPAGVANAVFDSVETCGISIDPEGCSSTFRTARESQRENHASVIAGEYMYIYGGRSRGLENCNFPISFNDIIRIKVTDLIDGEAVPTPFSNNYSKGKWEVVCPLMDCSNRNLGDQRRKAQAECADCYVFDENNYFDGDSWCDNSPYPFNGGSENEFGGGTNELDDDDVPGKSMQTQEMHAVHALKNVTHKVQRKMDFAKMPKEKRVRETMQRRKAKHGAQRRVEVPACAEFGAPIGGDGANAVMWGTKLVVFGGADIWYSELSSEVWTMDLASDCPVWEMYETDHCDDEPDARRDAVVAVHGSNLFIYGGDDGPDIWQMDFRLDNAKQKASKSKAKKQGAPFTDANLEADMNFYLKTYKDTWKFDLNGVNGWSKLCTSGTNPGRRTGHVGVKWMDPSTDTPYLVVSQGVELFNQDCHLSMQPPSSKKAAVTALNKLFNAQCNFLSDDQLNMLSFDNIRGLASWEARKDVWKLKLSGEHAWTKVCDGPGNGNGECGLVLPTGFYGAAATLWGDMLVISGGLKPPSPRKIMFAPGFGTEASDDIKTHIPGGLSIEYSSDIYLMDLTAAQPKFISYCDNPNPVTGKCEGTYHKLGNKSSVRRYNHVIEAACDKLIIHGGAAPTWNYPLIYSTATADLWVHSLPTPAATGVCELEPLETKKAHIWALCPGPGDIIAPGTTLTFIIRTDIPVTVTSSAKWALFEGCPKAFDTGNADCLIEDGFDLRPRSQKFATSCDCSGGVGEPVQVAGGYMDELEVRPIAFDDPPLVPACTEGDCGIVISTGFSAAANRDYQLIISPDTFEEVCGGYESILPCFSHTITTVCGDVETLEECTDREGLYTYDADTSDVLRATMADDTNNYNSDRLRSALSVPVCADLNRRKDTFGVAVKPSSVALQISLSNLAPGSAASLLALLANTLPLPVFGITLAAHHLGQVLQGTVTTVNPAVNVLDVDVINNPAIPSQLSDLIINIAALPANINRDTTWTFALPYGWTLDGSLPSFTFVLGGSTTVALTAASVVSLPATPGNNEIQVVLAPADFGGAGNFASGTTISIEITGGIRMPTSCLHLNGWIWVVKVTDNGSGTLTDYWVGNPMSDRCLSNSVVVFGDPHFNSFSGGYYDIGGKAGVVYNIISDQFFLWNAMFVSRPEAQHANMMTYIGKTAFRVLDAIVTADPETNEVILNGKLLESANRNYLANTTFFVKSEKNILIVRVPGFRIALKRVMRAHKHKLPHYDHAADLIRTEITHPHGLLGQTALFKEAVQSSDHKGTGVIDGKLEEYEVSDLTSYRFKYNRFGLSPEDLATHNLRNAYTHWSQYWMNKMEVPTTLELGEHKSLIHYNSFFITPVSHYGAQAASNYKFVYLQLGSVNVPNAISYIAKMYQPTDGTWSGKTEAVDEVEFRCGSGKLVWNSVQDRMVVNGSIEVDEFVDEDITFGNALGAACVVKRGHQSASVTLPLFDIYLRIDKKRFDRFSQQINFHTGETLPAVYKGVLADVYHPEKGALKIPGKVLERNPVSS